MAEHIEMKPTGASTTSTAHVISGGSSAHTMTSPASIADSSKAVRTASAPLTVSSSTTAIHSPFATAPSGTLFSPGPGSTGVSVRSWGFDATADRVLREFELLREKQLQLALDHISLPPLVVDDGAGGDDQATEAFEQSAARFQQREEDTAKLMLKLDELATVADSVFRFAEMG